MTKKDYELIENVFNAQFSKGFKDHGQVSMFWTLVEELGKKLMDQNPKFDYGKFIQACGANTE